MDGRNVSMAFSGHSLRKSLSISYFKPKRRIYVSLIPTNLYNMKDFQYLGKSVSNPPEDPKDATIETFPNEFTERDYLIQFDCADFTSLCPITGQPDFAKIRIQYTPDQQCIETKSLKYYLHSFRNFKGFNEKIINTILGHLVEVCQPKWMKVEGTFAARGGITLTTVAEYPNLDLDKVKTQPR